MSKNLYSSYRNTLPACNTYKLEGDIFVCFAAGEMMSVAEQFLEQQMHPTVVIGAYRQALEDILKIMKEEIR